MQQTTRDALDHSPIDLSTCREPIRLAVIDQQGSPRIVSLWFQYCDGHFYCATHESAWLVTQLRRDPRVGFEVSVNSPPYKGVRGSGIVELERLGDGLLLEELIQHYLGKTGSRLSDWLLSRQHQELIIKVTPTRVSCWDYSPRMAGSIDGSMAAHG